LWKNELPEMERLGVEFSGLASIKLDAFAGWGSQSKTNHFVDVSLVGLRVQQRSTDGPVACRRGIIAVRS